jgi:hypothetical protein
MSTFGVAAAPRRGLVAERRSQSRRISYRAVFAPNRLESANSAACDTVVRLLLDATLELINSRSNGKGIDCRTA